MNKIVNSILFLLISYPTGILIGVIFKLLRVLKTIAISHWERFPHWQKKLIVVSNHPALLEPFLLPALFFREYVLHPFQYAPWSTPDKKNFYDPWYWFWARPVSIPVDRGNERAELRSFFKMKEILNSGKIIILFPEGGRTEGGRTHQDDNFLYSKKGKKIRIFKDGLGWLVLKTGALVLPVWVEGTDKFLPNRPDRLFSWPRFRERIVIKIGKTLRFYGLPAVKRERVTQIIANALLKLADEPCAF